MTTEMLSAVSVSDSVICDLVRCLLRGESTIDFGHRVFTAAEEKGLIKWDSSKGFGGGYRAVTA